MDAETTWRHDVDHFEGLWSSPEDGVLCEPLTRTKHLVAIRVDEVIAKEARRYIRSSLTASPRP